MRGENRENNKGFTLIEAVVSMLILSVVILSIIGGFNIITNANYKAKKIQGANTLYSNINESLKDATDFAEAKYIVENEINGKEFSIGALKYTVEASIDTAGGVAYSAGASATVTPIPDKRVGSFYYIYYNNRYYERIDYYYSYSEGKYYFYGYKWNSAGTGLDPDPDKKYFESLGSGHYRYYDIDGIARSTNLTELSVTPTPATTATPTPPIVKSYDNYVYQLNSEDYAKFPVFDDSVLALKMDYTEYDAIQNVYTQDEIDLIHDQDVAYKNYQVSHGWDYMPTKILTVDNPQDGDKGRVNNKQVFYKFKKIWETDDAKEKTIVKYVITTMVTYNKGAYQYISDNFYGYDYVDTDAWVANGTGSRWHECENISWYVPFKRFYGVNKNNKYTIASGNYGLDGSSKSLSYSPYYGYSTGEYTSSASTTDRIQSGESLYCAPFVNTLNNSIAEYVIAEGEADGWSDAYGPTSTEAKAKLDAMSSIYLFYTPYIEANADGTPGTMKATDEKYLNLHLIQDESWDYDKQKKVFFLVGGKDANKITSSLYTGTGYEIKYWRSTKYTPEMLTHMLLGDEGLITNVRFWSSSAGAAIDGVYSRYTGINYSVDNNYNEKFKIVSDDTIYDDGMPDKATEVQVKIKFGNDQVLEKKWYLYFR